MSLLIAKLSLLIAKMSQLIAKMSHLIAKMSLLNGKWYSSPWYYHIFFCANNRYFLCPKTAEQAIFVKYRIFDVGCHISENFALQFQTERNFVKNANDAHGQI